MSANTFLCSSCDGILHLTFWLHSGIITITVRILNIPLPGLTASEAWLTDPDTRSHDKYLEHSAQQQRLSQLGA